MVQQRLADVERGHVRAEAHAEDGARAADLGGEPVVDEATQPLAQALADGDGAGEQILALGQVAFPGDADAASAPARGKRATESGR